ncbi:two-component sensor histidine kinase [Mycetocola reblochoni REB411]|uniref:histidine kinase n=2 Tax=Mycetocola reblochoni TaxID=331618 RepID=A0A1R4K8P7_9MICO|nr:two-component sensor histidine kinase [Mycetocola reblochoni REB411]
MAMLIVTALGLAVAGTTVYLLQRERILAQVDAELHIRVESVRAVIEGVQPTPSSPGTGTVTPSETEPRFSDVDEAVRQAVQQVQPDNFEGALGIVDGVARYAPGIGAALALADDPALVALAGGVAERGVVAIGTTESSFGTLRYLVVPITIDGAEGTGAYLAAVDLEAELADLGETMRSYTWVSLFVVVAVLVVGLIVAGRVLRPLRLLQESASRITASDLSERIPVGARDDLGELTRTVNGMIERLEDSFHARRRLLDDVRHELKTPITIVRGNIEVLDPADPSEVAEVMELATEELDRMALLIDDIALLADVESPGLTLTEVSLPVLTERLLSRVQAYAGHRWELARVDEGVVVADGQRILQAWLQLADNAAKYAPEGTTITLSARIVGDRAELSVSDRGPGVPREARERIFERFGRAHAGRGVDGSGLGLAIVQAIAVQHGGAVLLDSAEGLGSTFLIVIPVAGPGGTAGEAEGDGTGHPGPEGSAERW